MDKQTLESKLKFINDYKQASNAATGSQFDSNANVATKNIATLQCELGKKDLLDINRKLTHDYIEKLYGTEVAEQYLADLKNHIIYRHDETSIFPYCCSISLYPYLLNGLKGLGGSILGQFLGQKRENEKTRRTFFRALLFIQNI